MRTEKYFSAGAEVAGRGGLNQVRYRIADDRYILSESDLRNLVTAGKISPSEFRTLDIVEVTEAEAERLILTNGRIIGDQQPEASPEEPEADGAGEEDNNQEIKEETDYANEENQQ